MDELKDKSYTWLVTGVAGFIGSNIVEILLENNQKVFGLDNFSTGHRKNIKPFESNGNFKFMELDVSKDNFIEQVPVDNYDFILHQAALGSVPRSIENPIDSHESNVTGFLNMLELAKKLNVKKLVYASSSAVYGDDTKLPKEEDSTGNLLSPYAATKMINEVYGNTYFQTYDISSIGLRYFNVYGKRQDPNGAYAAVIPKWISLLASGESIQIFGDGTCSTRDYCHVTDVVKANILSALSDFKGHVALNIGTGEKTYLNDLSDAIKHGLVANGVEVKDDYREYQGKRKGDIEHSVANISKAKEVIGFKPLYNLKEGLEKTVGFYLKD